MFNAFLKLPTDFDRMLHQDNHPEITYVLARGKVTARGVVSVQLFLAAMCSGRLV